MLKKILLIVGLLLILILGLQFFWYHKYGGNLIIYIANSTETYQSLHVEIGVDDEIIGEYILSNEGIINYHIVPLRKSIGNRKIYINVNHGEFLSEKKIALINIRWLIVDVLNKNNLFNEEEEQLKISTYSQFKPPILR
ncbi:MAG: hypothetical protein K0B37_18005 [Bacteroidales bacterium]|nr:hypothetical protein [Bacteroidales bacterium]